MLYLVHFQRLGTRGTRRHDFPTGRELFQWISIYQLFNFFLAIIVFFIFAIIHSLSLFLSLILGQVDILKQFPVRACNDNFSFFLCSRVNTGRLDSFRRMPHFKSEQTLKVW